MTANGRANQDGREAGFTLIEALIAIIILVFGLIAITNLLIVAASSNTIGNHSSGATAQATEVLERLKAIPFNQLQVSAVDSLTADRGTTAPCDDSTGTCVTGSNYNAYKTVPGVGQIRTRWKISQVDTQVYFIEVVAESLSPLAGARSRASFTTFRSCTATAALGCP
jgi:hypothetical protein